MTIIKKIDQELKQHVDQIYKEGSIRYFKEKIKVFGVRGKIVDQIAQKYWQEIKFKSKPEIFNLCEELLKTGYNEKIKIGLDWSYRLKKGYQKSDFNIFLNWLKKYMTNWGSDDDLCVNYTSVVDTFNKKKGWLK
ncbi:MAG: DNA alkylation repair protein [Patescibacteria group bacterium]|nr:DNA alkylation repair protein [Patescibacteria group bacterium]